MTALLHLQNLSYSRGSLALFENINLTINPGDRIGLIGHNGSGKSSLLSLIAGKVQPDDGEVRIPRGQRLAFVEQFVPSELFELSLEQALLDALPAEQRIAERYRVDTLLQQLQFHQQHWQQAIASLSGGEQNLALLARAVLLEPDLLLMDEPGNHMDVLALANLKHYLTLNCKQSFLMISHDRELLDTCCNKSVFLRDKRIYCFDLPFESARSALAAHDEQAAHNRQTEEKEIKRLTASAKQLAQWGRDYDNEDLARKAKSMQKRVEKLQQQQTSITQGSGLDLQLTTEALRSKSVLILEKLRISTPDGRRQLLGCEFQHIRPGDRIVLLGKNGIGKSTTLNRLQAAFHSATDSIRFNPNTKLGFYDQNLTQFDSSRSRFDWLRDGCDCSDDKIKQALLNAGIAYKYFDRPVNALSGGECARMMFMLFQLNQPNFLILDEPTNHIDLEGREQLEQQLIDSGATLLITSHDQRFAERVAQRWWWINQGELQELHDPDEFYRSLTIEDRSSNAGDKQEPTQLAFHQQSGGEPATVESSEQVLMDKIDSLEKLLREDQARKAKFQKPVRQKQWQRELETLWARLEQNMR